jgi:hypothetical protein
MRFEKHILTLIFVALSLNLSAQDTLWKKTPVFSIEAFADVFYVYDFNQPDTTFRQPFLFNHNRHNEFNLNQGFIKLGLDHAKYRTNIALQAGTYANDNYAEEPGLLKNIFEANVGFSLNKKNNLWIDAGIFASHIGFESAISIENLTLTRSLLAENSPYFLSGAKLTYQPSAKWELTALVCNGWQRIQRVQGNSLPSFGTAVAYYHNEKLMFNWSTFIGTDDPDDFRRMRYFNNVYTQLQVGEKLSFIAGFDIGTQQQFKGSKTYHAWFSPVAIAQYAFTNRWKAAVRGEYYSDANGVIVPVAATDGFKTSGLSFNIDYSPIENLMFRTEGRWMRANDEIFDSKNGLTASNWIIATSIAIQFNKSFR